jgi:uncharacterized membrane protein
MGDRSLVTSEEDERMPRTPEAVRRQRRERHRHPVRVTYRHPANIARAAHQSRADKAVDRFVLFFGSLKFIGYMTVVIIAWIAVNSLVVAFRWDPYPFILLNLAFSAQATYAAPLILLSQNRAAEHDRLSAENDYLINENALAEIKANTALTEQVRALTAEVHRLVGNHQEETT